MFLFKFKLKPSLLAVAKVDRIFKFQIYEADKFKYFSNLHLFLT